MTDKNPRAGEYMTLSHCWGAAQFIKLQSDNIEELGKGIRLEKLPKTSQDAVAVAGWFNIRYLWIDSLCILQDSKEDWIKEFAKMRSVYSHSIMNISATGAVDSSVGCLLDRNADNLRAFRARLPDAHIDYICFDENFWQANISDAPLSKRAWACQERLLSPRILHFGATQMSWECMELASCETFPEGVPEFAGHLLSVITKEEFSYNVLGFSNSMWNKLVKYYTRCTMTVPSDIFVAFARVAEEIHSATVDEYFVGFWREDLEQQLLWKRERPATWKPTEYRAPSWSWFSAIGAVCPGKPYPCNYVRVFKVLDVIVHRPAEDLYGSVTYGCLKCQGILGRAVCQNKSVSWRLRLFHDRRLKGASGLSTCKMDHSTDFSERKVTYLPILVYEDNSIQGLLLEPTHVEEGQFQRVGKFTIRGEAECRSILRKQRSKNGTWVDRPQKIFTIV